MLSAIAAFAAAAEDMRPSFCVDNKRDEALKAYFDIAKDAFDTVNAHQRICWLVNPGITYYIADWHGNIFTSATINAANVERIINPTDLAQPPSVFPVGTLIGSTPRATQELAEARQRRNRHPLGPISEQNEAWRRPPAEKQQQCGDADYGCFGHGACLDFDAAWATCRCFSDSERGHWAPPTCRGCAAGWVGDDCTMYCHPNGVLEEGEACDDGNDVAGDGCTLCRLDSDSAVVNAAVMRRRATVIRALVPIAIVAGLCLLYLHRRTRPYSSYHRSAV